MLKMSLSLLAATLLWLSFPAGAAHVTKTDLMLEAYVNPEGDVLDVWVYLTDKEKEASLELRAYLISGEDNEKKTIVEASDHAKKRLEPIVYVDKDGNYLNSAAKAIRVDDHLRGKKPMQAYVAQTGFIIAYRDLKIPVGDHKIGFEISLLIDGKPHGDPFPTALSRIKVTEKPRETMTFTVERELKEGEEPQKGEKFVDTPGEQPRPGAKRIVQGPTVVTLQKPIEPGIYRSPIKGWGNNGASRIKEFVIRPRVEPEPAKIKRTVLPWEPKHHDLRLLYATNRNVMDGKQWSHKPDRYGLLASELRAGISFFDIPIDTHRMGVLELPSSPDKFDPKKHWRMRDLYEDASVKDFFKRQLTEVTRGYHGEDFIVFVHGYNNSLEFAKLRFMQMMYDIRFQGIPIAYLWPSAGEFKAYLDDEKRAEESWKPLADFLVQLIEARAQLDQPGKYEVGQIHLLAHSMGNRVLLKALTEVRKRLGDKKVFGIIVLAAADVDLADFNANMPAAIDLSEVVYNYHNADDVALKASRGVHIAKRAGAESVPFKGVINVDARKANATSIFTIGHDYYTSTNPLLYDFNMLFNEKKGPKERATLTEHFDAEKNITEYIFH